jgi:hypothetical protein
LQFSPEAPVFNDVCPAKVPTSDSDVAKEQRNQFRFLEQFMTFATRKSASLSTAVAAVTGKKYLLFAPPSCAARTPQRTAQVPIR